MATCRNFPMVLCGDFSGPAGLYPAVADALAAHSLIDVEGVPGLVGQGECSGTCRARGAKELARVDCFPVNAATVARLVWAEVPQDE
eukprot:15475601-Alexandrium_andersonii.AAC.1